MSQTNLCWDREFEPARSGTESSELRITLSKLRDWLALIDLHPFFPAKRSVVVASGDREYESRSLRRRLILARSEGHQSHFGAVLEELLSHLASVNGERPRALIRAEIVYFETIAGGAVFSTGSITFCGSLSYNDYDNNVSRMLENVLRRFAEH